MFGTGLYAQSVIINKISASELSRKFIKRTLFGWVVVVQWNPTDCTTYLQEKRNEDNRLFQSHDGHPPIQAKSFDF